MKKRNRLFDFICKHYVPIFIIIILCIASSTTICENDLFFDIKTGEDIVKNGITFQEHFSWIPNLKYLYLHWSYDIIIYYLHNLIGFFGLFVFFTSCCILFFLLYYYEIYKLTSNKIISLFITVFVHYICNYSFVSRVQSIIFILLFLEVLFLEKLYVIGQKKYMVYLILLSILVVNLQMPIWIFFCVLCLPYIFELILSIIDNKINIIKNIKLYKPKEPRIFIITMILIFFSGFLSPLTYNSYTFFLKSLGNDIYITAKIQEMQNTVIIHQRFIIAILFVMIIGIYFNKIKNNLRDFVMFFGIFTFSLIVNKNIIFFLYFGVYIIVKNTDFNNINKFFLKYLEKIDYKTINIFLSCILFPILIIVCHYKIQLYDNYGEFYYPKDMADYIIKNIDFKNSKIYTDYNKGSYYSYRGIPIFIDSRAEVYIKEFNGGFDVLSDEKKLYSYNYKEILDKYKFDYLIVNYDDILYENLKNTNNYCFIYFANGKYLFKYVVLDDNNYFNN